MNFSLNPFGNEFDSISSPSELYSSNDDISEVFLDILFRDKQDVNENNIKIRLEPFFKVEKDKISNDRKRGRRKKQNKSLNPFETREIKRIHGNITLSNILFSIDKINKISIKLSDYGLNKSLKNNLNSQSYLFPNYTNSPEILLAIVSSMNTATLIGRLSKILLYDARLLSLKF